jgi:hypothetical protein
VRGQKLELMFEDGIIERERIVKFNKGNPFIAYQDMTDDELNEFIDNVVWFIKQRNEYVDGV